MDKVLFALQTIISEVVAAQAAAGTGPLKDIKAIYYGDPVQIAETKLPAITIKPAVTSYTMRGSRYDQKTLAIDIALVVNRKTYYNEGTTDDTVHAARDMVQRLEAQGDEQDVLHSTLAGIIQSNVCLHYVDGEGIHKYPATLTKVENIQYTFGTSRGFPTYEGVMRIRSETVGDR